jgi:ABC-2 type transport system ATP-binding protein
MEEAVRHVRELPEVIIDSVMENRIILNMQGDDLAVNRIMISLMTSGVVVRSFRREEQNLETLFMKLTGQAPAGQEATQGGR